jgi:hypothetical protein
VTSINPVSTQKPSIVTLCNVTVYYVKTTCFTNTLLRTKRYSACLCFPKKRPVISPPCEQSKKTFASLFTENCVYILPCEIKKHLTISNKCLESRNTTDKLRATSQVRKNSFNFKQLDGAFKKLDTLRRCTSWNLLGATNLTFRHLPLASKHSVSTSFLFLDIYFKNCTHNWEPQSLSVYSQLSSL